MDKLILQQRTKNLSLRIFKMVEKLPKTEGARVITYQILKSSSSTAANYRAACRAKSDNDFVNKLKIVEEEADETLFWLEFIEEAGLLKKSLLSNLHTESNELVAIFTASLKTLKSKDKKQDSKKQDSKKQIIAPTDTMIK
ncbi:MAG: four helix bundle protein [Bacteroidia bacterium]